MRRVPADNEIEERETRHVARIQEAFEWFGQKFGWSGGVRDELQKLGCEQATTNTAVRGCPL